jgi:hypothetical protein
MRLAPILPAPVYNHSRKEVTTANILDKKTKEDPNIRFYEHDEGLSNIHKEISIQYGNPVRSETLHNATLFLCPKCNNFMLRFIWAGMWD